MRRVLAYLLVWTLGTAATVGACWLGLRSVLDAASPHRAAPFSAAELARPSPSPVIDEAIVLPPSEGIGSPEATAETTAPTTGPSTTGSTPNPAASGGGDGGGGLQGLAMSADSTASSGWTAVPGARIATFRRTFTLVGGELTFQCNPYDVDLTHYKLNPGFTIATTRYSLRSMQISLLSSDHASRVYVTWRDGPYAEVTETVG